MSAKVFHPPHGSVLTEAALEEIERLARENNAEAFRGPLLALVGEVRRLREAREVDRAALAVASPTADT